jgi:hypothetical protein
MLEDIMGLVVFTPVEAKEISSVFSGEMRRGRGFGRGADGACLPAVEPSFEKCIFFHSPPWFC